MVSNGWLEVVGAEQTPQTDKYSPHRPKRACKEPQLAQQRSIPLAVAQL
jgi:hypothetical protein